MADFKIENYVDVDSIDGTELVLVSKSGAYRKTTIEEIRNLAANITNTALVDLVGKVASAQDVKNILNTINTQLSDMANVKMPASALGLLPNTDITSKLQAILDDANNKYQIEFIKSAEYIISDTITIDLFKNSIIGNGCIWSSKIIDEDKWSVILTSSLSENSGNIRTGGSPVGNIVDNFKGVILQTYKNDDYYRKSNGLFLNNLKGKPADIILEQNAILGFNKGTSFGSNTYRITFDKISIAYCNTCVALESGYSDMGEKISFLNGVIGDSDLSILNTTDQALHFHNMSLDFSNKLCKNSGQLYFTNCHLEIPLRYFDITSEDNNHWGEILETGSVFIDSCRMLIAYKESESEQLYLPYLFKCDSDSCGLYITNCHTNIFANYFINDYGKVRVKNTHRYNVYSPFVYTQAKQNYYVDENCTQISNISSDNTDTPVVINGGYECTHRYQGQNTVHTIKLPKLSSFYKITIEYSSQITVAQFFNAINVKTIAPTKAKTISFGTADSIIGDNKIELHLNFLNQDIAFFNPNEDLVLTLQTFNIPNNTKFTITKIIINQIEN